jgi:hypothetical protein
MKHVHHIDVSRRVLTLGLAAFEILVGIVILLRVIQWASYQEMSGRILTSVIIRCLVGLAAILTGIGNAYLVNRVRVITSADGIEYHNIGLILRVPWDGVLAVENVPRGFRRGDRLILGQAEVHLSSWRPRWKVEQMTEAIGLQPFERAWKHGQLGEDVKRFAPHLFLQGETGSA